MVVWARASKTHFLRRLSSTLQSALSHLQLPHGNPSTTSHLTLRARHIVQARAALRFVGFWFTEA